MKAEDNRRGLSSVAALLAMPLFFFCGMALSLPIIPMVLNSLFWGWAIMALVMSIKRRRAPAAAPSLAEGSTRGVRPFLVGVLVLALFSYAITPVAAGSAIVVFTAFLLLLMVSRAAFSKLGRKKEWTTQKTSAMLYGCMTGLLVVFILLTLAPWSCVSEMGLKRGENSFFTETVTRLKRMQDRRIPFHLMMLGGIRSRTDFDVNWYFTVLDRLAPQSGWTLDYVYAYDQLGGWPVLYARRTWSMPILTFEACQNARPESLSEKQPEYLQHVRTDGTAEGFVQLAVLRIMANQFYLFWHANYNDQLIVSDRSQLESFMAKQDMFHRPTLEEKQKALSCDPQPAVEMLDSTVRVSLLTWSDRGGLYRKTFTFSREFPHRLMRTEQEQVASYFCGVIY